MSWSFCLVAADQIINNAPKMLYMSGGQFPVPMVFRAITVPAVSWVRRIHGRSNRCSHRCRA